MKRKTSILLLSLILSVSLIVPVFAYGKEPEESTETEIQSQPRLMVTDYSTDGIMAPGSVFRLKITVTNTGKTADVRNIKVSVSEGPGTILPWKIDSAYISSLNREKSTECTLTMKVSEDASSSYCSLHVSMEYEDYEGRFYSSSDSLTLSVKKKENTTEDSSQPILMITGYSIKGTPGKDESFTLSLLISNKDKTKDAKNVKVTFMDGSGTVVPVGVSSGFISSVSKGGTVTWSIPLKVAAGAEGGNCMPSISMEYETPDGGKLSASDTVVISVPKKETASVDASRPRLLLISYSVENNYISPDEQRNLSVTIKNTSDRKTVRNILLTLSDAAGELKPEKTGSVFVSSIGAGKSYTWVTKISAVHSAQTGEHALSFSIDYEDESGNPYSSTNSLSLPVRQNAALSFNNAKLPVKVIQGDTETLTVSFMNTGKSVLSNCLMKIDIPHLDSGGSVLVGEIKPGETKAGSMNLRVDNDFLGDTSGSLYISYEDEFGEVYSDEVKLSTYVQEKIEIIDTEVKEEKKNTLWWLFVIIGIVVGGGIGAGIPIAINSSKQRRIDEESL